MRISLYPKNVLVQTTRALAGVAFIASVVLSSWSVSAAEMLAVGESFPVWELTDDHDALISSADLAGGRYLIWFYPKAMTPG